MLIKRELNSLVIWFFVFWTEGGGVHCNVLTLNWYLLLIQYAKVWLIAVKL